jgi:SAM-dependent methyltransferase
MATHTCPVCLGSSLSVFFERMDVPVHCNLLWPTQTAARQVPRGDIRLGYCALCGMIYNISFEQARMSYGGDYENSLHFSPRFESYAEELAKSLVARDGLYGKQIVEIGCGDGHFLSLLCTKGKNQGVGFDPSYRADGSPVQGMTVIRDFYTEAYGEYGADFICCRQVLEHLAEPRRMLEQLRRTVGHRAPVLFFEVPNALHTLRDLGIWDIIYEHPSYFSAPSLSQLFASTGFAPDKVYSAYSGQFLCLEAVPSNGGATGVSTFPQVEMVEALVGEFADHYRTKLAEWEGNLDRLREQGRRIALWGAGSKGVMFLNSVGGTAEAVGGVVDVNPRKQGHYVSGTGHAIQPPEWLREFGPDAVVIMNPVYKDEIEGSLTQLGISAEVLVA